MELILLIVQLVLAIFLIGSVLIQRSDTDGFGLGSGGGGGLLSSRGQANLMTRTTAVLATLFMVNSLVLSILTTQGSSRSLVDEVVEQQPFSAPRDGAEPVVNSEAGETDEQERSAGENTENLSPVESPDDKATDIPVETAPVDALPEKTKPLAAPVAE